jgi:hypothetical protein
MCHMVSNFYGTEIEIWAGFEPVGSTEKSIGLIMSKFRKPFFMLFKNTGGYCLKYENFISANFVTAIF